MFGSQSTQIQCPQCNQPFTAQVHNIVDVGQNPNLKDQLLRGNLNVAKCSHCSYQGMLGAPLLYHDPEKELLLCLIPMELELNREQQEKIIGDLTNQLIDSLPGEQRKAYMLQPETMFSLQRLAERILEAEGITREMLEEHTKKAELIQELAERVNDEEAFKDFVEERRDRFDYEFFLILSSTIDAAREEGDEVGAKRLGKVREKLLAATGGPGGPVPKPMEDETTHEEMIEKLLQAEDEDELRTLVMANRPRFDYTFFQTLTGQIEQAQGDEAEQLRRLRSQVLEITDQLDRETRAALDRAAALLQRIVESEDPERMVREHLDEIDETFLLVLSANIAQAEEDENEEVVEALRGLYGYIITQIEEQMPPRVRLLNRLLRRETPDEREGLLEQQSDLLDEEFAKMLSAMEEDVREQGLDEIVERLEEIEAQVNTIVKGKA